MSSSDVSQLIQELLRANYEIESVVFNGQQDKKRKKKKKIHQSCADGIEKSLPHNHSLSPLASLVMPNRDPRAGFFYPTLTLMMDSYNIPKQLLYSEFHIKSYISITVDVSLKHTKHVSCVCLCLTSHQQLRSHGEGGHS